MLVSGRLSTRWQSVAISLLLRRESEANRHILQEFATDRFFRFNLSREALFAVADSIQSLLNLFDIKPWLAVGRKGGRALSKLGLDETGKGYG